MGDASVARTPPAQQSCVPRFSPLPMGDASVALGSIRLSPILLKFQSPSHGGRFCCGSLRIFLAPACGGFSPLPMGDASVAVDAGRVSCGFISVSVPFPWGTLLLPLHKSYSQKPLSSSHARKLFADCLSAEKVAQSANIRLPDVSTIVCKFALHTASTNLRWLWT